MLDTGSLCPKCAVGTIVLVSRYQRAVDKPYSSQDLAGPIPFAQTLFRCSTGLVGTHIGYLLDDPPRLARPWGDLMAFLAARGIRPVVGTTFSFDEMAEAHRLMESRRSVGKIVVRV